MIALPNQAVVIGCPARTALAAGNELPDRAERNEKTLTARKLPHGFYMRHIGGVIDKTRDMHAMPLGQMRQHGVRAYLIALVRRIRNAMTEK